MFITTYVTPDRQTLGPPDRPMYSLRKRKMCALHALFDVFSRRKRKVKVK